MKKRFTRHQKGFTLIEALVGSALFLLIAFATYESYASIFKLVAVNQYKILAIQLANEQFEIIRNMPYNSIGIVNGIPSGSIPEFQTFTRGTMTLTATTTVRNIDLPFDGLVGSTTNNDLSPADNKLVSMTIACPTCTNLNPVTLMTQISPKNLETASTNGAIVISVFDANGNPVSGANVHLVNSHVIPNTVVDDTTNNYGALEIVDAPPATSAYNITISKPGYSTDKTYPPGGIGNPNPSKPDATVLLQQITPISFAIDKTSVVKVSSVTPTCSVVPNIDFTVVGSKTIGPGVPKFAATTTTGSTGTRTFGSMEWDSYTFNFTDSDYDLAGLNVLNPVTVDPNSTQKVLLVVLPKNPDSLMITVKDSVNGLPLTGATVTLSNEDYSSTQTTGVGYLTQTDWSGGAGQSLFTTDDQYWVDDGGVTVQDPAGDVRLLSASGTNSLSGVLESSTFDTGSPSVFHSLIIQPGNQPASVGTSSVLFQIATDASSTPATWNYVGPDGTADTYYDTANSVIGTMHDGDQYLRYKMFLSSPSPTSTPNVSDVSFTYTTACTPPGQVIFQGLEHGAYTLTVSNNGYTSYSSSVNVSSPWKEVPVLLSH